MSDRLHEMDFCIDGKPACVIRGASSPPIGATVQLRRIDYTVTAVYWTIDSPTSEPQTLRIVIDMTKATP